MKDKIDLQGEKLEMMMVWSQIAHGQKLDKHDFDVLKKYQVFEYLPIDYFEKYNKLVAENKLNEDQTGIQCLLNDFVRGHVFRVILELNENKKAIKYINENF